MADASRYLALDVGERRIGVAVSDPLGLTAQPVCVVHRTSAQEDRARIWALIEQYAPRCIVCGLPKSMDGRESAQAAYTRDFIAGLFSGRAWPIVFWDERLSTVSASRVLIEADMRRAKRRQVVDKIAACLILQSFLDAGAPGA